MTIIGFYSLEIDEYCSFIAAYHRYLILYCYVINRIAVRFKALLSFAS